jgi:hypothetical protein
VVSLLNDGDDWNDALKENSESCLCIVTIFVFLPYSLYALDLGFGDSLFAQIVITEKQKYRKTDRD